MDLPEDAHRIYGWVRVAVVGVVGLALGAALASGLVWSRPEKLPDRERIAEIAALVYPVAPEWIGGEDSPGTVPHEDWPMEAWWQKLFFGHSDQGGVAGASWSDAEIAATDAIAYQRLVDAEAALRTAGWTIDGYGDALRRVDGTPTPDDILTAHQGQVEVVLDSYGGETPSLSIYPLPYPTPAAPVLACAAAGLVVASAWLFLRRRHRRRHRIDAGLTGPVGVAFLVPSALAVTVSFIGGGWGVGAADLWQAARFPLPVLPLGALMNIGLLLLLVDAYLQFRRARRGADVPVPA
ncbi:hypothetical protein [Phytomonospora endophytica]|uniref:Uncharacterized protein n=1 Tax=Phytomonospora endophytica TaxID=714109 RepID=A0A841FWD6_9ACTN|nr:hypothetical protein [Phytomonospora endophytica]MBB6038048.1 hypothetical protein [Phytomonospora endophytica]GIG67488.1 hypothetical protein Pen01_37830 [Phytomonospora endophytica]